MRNIYNCLLSAVVLLLPAALHAQTYQQVWADEFNGTSVSTANWKFETGGGGWGNNEKQYYQASNATVANGNLTITARKQSVGGLPYTSARMTTQGLHEFKYGKIEANIKIPLGQGLWPAFWALGSNIGSVGWPKCGELDIMEQVNADSRVYGTAHWDNNGQADYGNNTAVSANTFHKYSIEWTPTYVRWFVDGTKYHEINIANNAGGTEEFQRPFFILLNLAVAGNWPGQNVDESKLPATMVVDYVRVYQLTGARTAAVLAVAPGLDSPAAPSLYPNPVIGHLALADAASFRGGEVRIISVEGREVWRGLYTGETVDVSALKPGLYTLVATSKDQQKLTSRFSKL